MTTTTDMQGQAAANVMEARVRADRPHRVQLSRKKGWRMPENTVSVARPGRWGNPFPVAKMGPYLRWATDAAAAVALFEEMVNTPHLRAGCYPDHATMRRELAGKNLACWCPLDKPCHADVLLELANRDHAPIVQREVG